MGGDQIDPQEQQHQPQSDAGAEPPVVMPFQNNSEELVDYIVVGQDAVPEASVVVEASPEPQNTEGRPEASVVVEASPEPQNTEGTPGPEANAVLEASPEPMLLVPSAISSCDVPYATKDKVVSALFTLRSAEIQNDNNEPPIDVNLVLDVSGSMSGDKLKLAKKTCRFVAEQLRPCDRLGLITYDTHVKVVQDLTPMSDTVKSKFAALVTKIRAGSQTNLSGGILEAIQQMKTRPPPKATVSSVFLVTDGLANQGITGDSNIIEAVGGALGQFPDPPSVYTFGIGADHNADLLQGIAESARAGTYYFIENEEMIPESFASALGGLLSVVAQNITVTFEAAEGHSLEQAPMAAKKNDVTITGMPFKCTVRFGDIFSEERRDMLLDIKLPALAKAEESSTAVNVKITYFDVEKAKMIDFEAPIAFRRPLSTPENQTEHPLVTAERNRCIYNRAVSEATKLADRGDHAGAKKIVTDAISAIVVVDGDDATEGLLDDLKDTLQDISSYDSWNSGGRHYTTSSLMMNVQQRSNMGWESACSPRAATKSMEMRGKKNRYANKKKSTLMKSARAYADEEE